MGIQFILEKTTQTPPIFLIVSVTFVLIFETLEGFHLYLFSDEREEKKGHSFVLRWVKNSYKALRRVNSLSNFSDRYILFKHEKVSNVRGCH